MSYYVPLVFAAAAVGEFVLFLTFVTWVRWVAFGTSCLFAAGSVYAAIPLFAQ